MFGGTPLFSKPRPVGQLAMPDIDAYLSLVHEAFDMRRLSRSGRIVQQLERELAQFHGVDHCIAVANAGLGLVVVMQICAQTKGTEVIMPAFSYPGLPHFARWAGQLPRFCDVDETSHSLDLESVRSSIGKTTSAILAVCNFNSPGNIDALTELAADHRIPLLFDSVNGIGSTYKGRQLGGFGCAEVFSTHATKLLNGFEGGYVTTNDNIFAKAVREKRESEKYNIQLNELHAAMALLCLRELDSLIARNEARFKAYQLFFRDFPGLHLIPYDDEGVEKTSYQMAVVGVREPWPLSRHETILLLQAEGAAISGYYTPALHRSAHCPRDVVTPSLPVAESLATQFLKLPVGELVSISDIALLNGLMTFVSQNGEQIRERLNEGAVS